MNRKDLIASVAKDADLTHDQAEAALRALIDAVVAGVAHDDKVVLPGFGTFELRHRSARAGRNPQTGEPMEIAASMAPAFKPAAAFKQAVADR